VRLAALLAAAFALRAWLGLGEMGLYWPDEVRQSLEPAHHIVFGYAVLPWEYVEGARSWAFPGLLAAVLWPLQAVGLDDPAQYLPAFRLLFVLVGVATAGAVWALVRVLGGSPVAALGGAAGFAFAGPIAYFGHRALGETAAALPVAAGFALALAGADAWERAPRRARRLLLAGAALLGLAVLVRLQTAVLAAGLLAILAGRRRWRAAAEAAAVLVAAALLLGVLDLVTWGGLFHSVGAYVEFNVLEGGASAFGTQPPWWYGELLLRAMPVVALLLGAGVLAAAGRWPGPVLVVAAFVALHVVTPHKELRFLLPVLPLACALAAVGLERLHRLAPAALAAAALVSGLAAPGLTARDVGLWDQSRPDASAWGRFEQVNRLLLEAHDRPDLCGLKVEAAPQTFSGGLSHLHRDVPYLAAEGPGRASGLFNYVITGSPPVLARIRRDCPAS